MSKDKKNAANAATRPEPKPAAVEAETREAQAAAADPELVRFTIPEETASALFSRLQECAEANLTGGNFEADYTAAAECARILTELETAWNDAPAADDEAARRRHDAERARLTAECERLTSEVEELRARLALEIGPKCAECRAECGKCPPACLAKCDAPAAGRAKKRAAKKRAVARMTPPAKV